MNSSSESAQQLYPYGQMLNQLGGANCIPWGQQQTLQQLFSPPIQYIQIEVLPVTPKGSSKHF